ncbi:TPA: DUF262 domain-containing protein [Bacillus pseudomycoides]|nr:DUF262 domain-containing protein [Bacillus pseudomycoides]
MNQVNLDFLIKKEKVEIEDRSSVKTNVKNNNLLPLNSLLRESEFLSSIRKPRYQRKTSWSMSTIINYLEDVIEGRTVVLVNVLKKSNDKILIIDGIHRLSTLIGWLNDDYGDGVLSTEQNNCITEEDKQHAEQIRSLINNKIGAYKEKKHTEKIREIKIQLVYLDDLVELPQIFKGIRKENAVKIQEAKEKKVFFAFLDILGFKDLVNNNSNESLIDLYSKVIDGSVESALSKGQINIDENGNIKPDLGFASVNTLVISDSILFWTNHDHPWSFIDLIIVVREVLYNSMKAGIPLRGAIARGPIVTQQSNKSKENILIHRFTVVGKALVEAYKKEAIQDWSGCLIDEECIKSLSDSVISDHLDVLINNNILIKYKVPYKSGNIKEEYVLNWVGKKLSYETVRESFSMHNKGVDNWAVESKIKNTIEFLTHVQSL